MIPRERTRTKRIFSCRRFVALTLPSEFTSSDPSLSTPQEARCMKTARPAVCEAAGRAKAARPHADAVRAPGSLQREPPAPRASAASWPRPRFREQTPHLPRRAWCPPSVLRDALGHVGELSSSRCSLERSGQGVGLSFASRFPCLRRDGRASFRPAATGGSAWLGFGTSAPRASPGLLGQRELLAVRPPQAAVIVRSACLRDTGLYVLSP